MRRSFILSVLCLLVFLPSHVHAQNQRAAREHLKRGLLRFSRGDIRGAINEYTKAIEANPRFAEAYLNRGLARRARGDLDGAIDDYEKAVEIEPALGQNNQDITQAYANRGFMRSNELDLDGAISDFNNAIKHSPSDAESYIKRGRALLINGE